MNTEKYIVCDCGIEYTYSNRSKHLQTNKHRDRLEKIKENPKISMEELNKTKEKINGSDVINCKCGMSYTYYNRSRHFKTKQHLETMRELEELDDDTSLDAQEGQHIGTIQGIRYRAKGLIGELECDDLSEEQIQEINRSS